MPFTYRDPNEVAVSGTPASFTTQLVGSDKRDAVNICNSLASDRLAIALGTTVASTKYHYLLMPGETIDIEVHYGQVVSVMTLDGGLGDIYITEMIWSNQNMH